MFDLTMFSLLLSEKDAICRRTDDYSQSTPSPPNSRKEAYSCLSDCQNHLLSPTACGASVRHRVQAPYISFPQGSAFCYARISYQWKGKNPRQARNQSRILPFPHPLRFSPNPTCGTSHIFSPSLQGTHRGIACQPRKHFPGLPRIFPPISFHSYHPVFQRDNP